MNRIEKVVRSVSSALAAKRAEKALNRDAGLSIALLTMRARSLV